MVDVTVLVIATYMMACSGAILFAIITLYFHRLYGRRYLLFWAMSWFALSVYLLGGAFAVYATGTIAASHPARLLSSFFTMTAAYLQIVWLLFGAYELSTDKKITTRASRGLFFGALVLTVFVTFAFVFDPDAAPLRYLLRVGLKSLLTGLSFLGGAYALCFVWTRQRSLGQTLVCLAFTLYGVSLLAQVSPPVFFFFGDRSLFAFMPYFVLVDFLQVGC